MLDVGKYLEEFYEIKMSTDVVGSTNQSLKNKELMKTTNLYKEIIQRLVEEKMQLTALRTEISWKDSYLNQKEKQFVLKLHSVLDQEEKIVGLVGRSQKENGFLQKSLSTVKDRELQLKIGLEAIRKRKEGIRLQDHKLEEKIKKKMQKISAISRILHL